MGRVFSFITIIVLFAVSCGGRPDSVNQYIINNPTYSDDSVSSPSNQDLEQILDKEFTRLGIDPDKVPAAVASGDDAAVFDLALTVVDPDGDGGDPPTGIELSWTERMGADYNQDGLVSVSDLTPIGQHFREAVSYDDPTGHDGFEYWPAGDPDDGSTGADNWRRARIDGNGDGVIEISDITPLALHWNEFMSGYVIERAVNQGTGQLIFDEDWVDIGYGSTPSVPRSVNYLEGELAVDPNLPVRYSVTVPLDDVDQAQYFRVRPYDAGTDEDGWESNSVAYVPTASGDTTPPVWTDTVGVTGLTPSAGQLTVEFGTAEDEQSPPVSYRVYWAGGDPEQPDAEFDYDTAYTADTASSPYVITGLTDGQYYRVAVRAMDSADTPNIEENYFVFGDIPQPRDIYPPTWQETVGLQYLWYGNDTAVLGWGPAIDDTTDDYGTWTSGPVIYTVYYGNGSEPDWDNSNTIEFEDDGREFYYIVLDHIDTSINQWYAVRARDNAFLVNEDDNIVFLSGKCSLVSNYDFPTPGPEIPEESELITIDTVCNAFGTEAGLTLDYLSNDNKLYSSLYLLDGLNLNHSVDLYLGEFSDKFRILHRHITSDGNYRIVVLFDPTLNSNTITIAEQNNDTLSRILPTGFNIDKVLTNINDNIQLTCTVWNGDILSPYYWCYTARYENDFSTPYFEYDATTSEFYTISQPCYLTNLDFCCIAAYGRVGNSLYYQTNISPSSDVTFNLIEPFAENFTIRYLLGRNVEHPVILSMYRSETNTITDVIQYTSLDDVYSTPPLLSGGYLDWNVNSFFSYTFGYTFSDMTILNNSDYCISHVNNVLFKNDIIYNIPILLKEDYYSYISHVVNNLDSALAVVHIVDPDTNESSNSIFVIST